MPKTLVLNTKYDWAAMWLVYLGDATLEEISDMFDVPYGTVVEYSRTHYWAANRAAAKKRGLSVTAQQLKSRVERGRNKHLNHMLDQIDETQEHIANLQIAKPGDDDKTKVTVGSKLALIEQHDRIARKTLGLDEENTGDPIKDGFNFLIGMAKAHKALVNESPDALVNENTEHTEGENITDVDAEIVADTPQSEGEKTSSATIPLPVDSDAFAGILSPFNGHINAMPNTQNEPISDQNGTNGATKPYKSLPAKIILSR